MSFPGRAIKFKGGVSFVNRDDEPTYQCVSCYKPWFDDELDLSVIGEIPKCPNCLSNIRKLTKEQPLE